MLFRKNIFLDFLVLFFIFSNHFLNNQNKIKTTKDKFKKFKKMKGKMKGGSSNIKTALNNSGKTQKTTISIQEMKEIVENRLKKNNYYSIVTSTPSLLNILNEIRNAISKEEINELIKEFRNNNILIDFIE